VLTNSTITKIAGLMLALQSLAGANAAVAGQAHKVLSTYIDSGNPQTALSSGYSTIESMTVTCPQTKPSCTLVLSVMDQISTSHDNSPWAIVESVDGVLVDGSPSQSPLNIGFSTIGNWLGNYSVGAGKHKVQFQTYVEDANDATQGVWSVHYTVAAP
jgi:hypothetical protein